LAKHFGYCFGVQRAIDMVESALREGPYPVWTLGPVIHNPQVMKDFCARGVREAKTPKEITEGTVVLRAHGTTSDELEEIPQGVRILDATCPFVARAQKRARDSTESGHILVVVGDRGHPEVRAILSQAGSKGFCVRDGEEFEVLLPEIKMEWEKTQKPVVVVAQTTSRKDDVEKATDALKKGGIPVDLANTICTATGERQRATLELARECDLVLVVGSRTSANTGQLFRIARENCAEAYLVESGEDVDPRWFLGKRKVGVAAGASTPDRVIKEVVGKVEEIEKSKKEPEELRKEGEDDAQKVTEQEAGPQERGENQESAEKSQENPLEDEKARHMYDESFKALEEGQIVEGRVVSVEDDGTVLVDIGYKSEGRISASDFQRRGALAPEKLSPGDKIMVYVLSVDSGEGGLRLSKRKADEELAWRNLEDAYREGRTIEAPCVQEVKGGLVVDVGLRGFVPASQVERGYVNDLAKYVGKTLRMRVLELDRSKNRVILSQRVVLEEEHERLCQETWASIAEGQIRTGVVKGITDFGVFVDLGGVDGLLHISELSWGRVKHPSEVVSEGEEIAVKVLKVDKEKGKISLGRKQVLPDPWENVEAKYPVGSVVEGEVTRTAPFGAFIQLEPGVEGLAHISEISDQHISKPEEVIAAGDKVMVKVLRVRPQERKISLSIRQADQIHLSNDESVEEGREEGQDEVQDPGPRESQSKTEIGEIPQEEKLVKTEPEPSKEEPEKA